MAILGLFFVYRYRGLRATRPRDGAEASSKPNRCRFASVDVFHPAFHGKPFGEILRRRHRTELRLPGDGSKVAGSERVHTGNAGSGRVRHVNPQFFRPPTEKFQALFRAQIAKLRFQVEPTKTRGIQGVDEVRRCNEEPLKTFHLREYFVHLRRFPAVFASASVLQK